ncbi:glycosyltransferase family 2 protein [Pararhodobacter oceanensis]|uniref:glycosyltransferase family 2 protein n=1 Tax=Pararhodobacter oceanensis TaxID=2172121 RepID=UPI003A94258F
MTAVDELISVIIPVYNGADFLADAIDCVSSQTDAPLEIIIVDDGSVDGSYERARALAPKATVIRQANLGPGAARNTGLRAAKGRLIAFLDVDDLWPDGKLLRQASRMQSEPELSLVLGLVQHVVAPGADHFDMKFEDNDTKTIPFFHFGAGLYRREAFDTVGPVSETLKDSEDHDWFFRFREAGLYWVVENDVGLLYRRHFSNMTKPGPLQQTDVFHVIAQSLARRRKKSAPKVLTRLTERRDPCVDKGSSHE